MSKQSFEQEFDEKVVFLKASRFKQQDLTTWRPIATFFKSFVTFFLFGLVFTGVGILLNNKSKEI
jgi:hypothetical protein